MGLELKDASAVTLPWLCSSGMAPEVARRVPYAPKHLAAVWDRFLFSPLGQTEAGPGCSSVCWVSLMQWESAAMSVWYTCFRRIYLHCFFMFALWQEVFGGKAGLKDNVGRLLPFILSSIRKSFLYSPARKVYLLSLPDSPR